MSRTTEGLPTAPVVGPLFRLVDELADTFRGVFSRDTIERYVDDTYELLASQATVTAHLVTLTTRFARQRLIDYGHAEGLNRVTVPQVLFVCVHNIGRSRVVHRWWGILEPTVGGRTSVQGARGPVRLRAQRRPLPDGCRAAGTLRPRPDRRPLGRIHSDPHHLADGT